MKLKVKWVWKDDLGDFLVKLVDGMYSEYHARTNTWIDYKDTDFSSDSVLILVNRLQSNNDTIVYVKVTDTIIYFSDTMAGLDSNDSRRVFPGKWDPFDQEGIFFFYSI